MCWFGVAVGAVGVVVVAAAATAIGLACGGWYS